MVASDCEVVWKGNQSKPATSKNPVSHYQVAASFDSQFLPVRYDPLDLHLFLLFV